MLGGELSCGESVLTLEAAAAEWIPDIVGEAGAGGTVVHHAALRIEAARARTRVKALVPEKHGNHQMYVTIYIQKQGTTNVGAIRGVFYDIR